MHNKFLVYYKVLCMSLEILSEAVVLSIIIVHFHISINCTHRHSYMYIQYLHMDLEESHLLGKHKSANQETHEDTTLMHQSMPRYSARDLKEVKINVHGTRCNVM